METLARVVVALWVATFIVSLSYRMRHGVPKQYRYPTEIQVIGLITSIGLLTVTGWVAWW